MKFRSYNKEIRTATAQILDVFNDIVIDRRDNDGVQKLILVPCIYGNRSRILKSLENVNKTLKVPVMAISKGSITRDASRVSDLHLGMTLSPGASFDLNKMEPTPIDIEFTMAIITRYEDDMDQIISNFIPMMSPDFYVVWPHPKQPGKNIKSQIVWGGTCDYEYPSDISETDHVRVIVNASFTYKTWIFPGMGEDADDGPNIHKINYCPTLLSIEDDNFMLDRWYDVPMEMSIDNYLDNVTSGLIKKDQSRNNWDWLPMNSENCPITGWPNEDDFVDCNNFSLSAFPEDFEP